MKPNWLPVSRHWYFPQISEEQESWRTGRRKIVQTPRPSDQAQKVARCCSAALEASGPNWTVKPLVFLISSWRFILLALVFVKFFWQKVNCRGVSLLWIVHRKSSQEQNNKRRLQVGLGVTELLNDCSFNYFPTSYCMARLMFVFIHDFVEFVSTERRRVCLFLQLISLSTWTRREFYICELDFSNLGPSIFAWLVWFY